MLELLSIVGFIVILFIWTLVEDYKDKKFRERFKYLTGKYKHTKHPGKTIIELEHFKNDIKVFKIATKEEIQYLKRMHKL